MPRGIRITAIVAMILVGALAMPVANAAPERALIADPTLQTFVTASTADRFVRMQPRQSNNLQVWTLDRSPLTTSTKVVNVGTAGCLTISPTSPIAEGVPLAQLACQGTTAERWRIVADSSTSRVRFVNVRTGWCMTIEPNSPGTHPLLRLYRCGQTLAQQFVIRTQVAPTGI
jgi:hypothetical protein